MGDNYNKNLLGLRLELEKKNSEIHEDGQKVLIGIGK